MAHHDAEKTVAARDAAKATLLSYPPATRTISLEVIAYDSELLTFIAGRFPDLEELRLHPGHFKHPFGDITVSADDFATQRTIGVGTMKACAITIGTNIGSRYADVLRPLHKLQKLDLGVSLYGAYGSSESDEDDNEPEMEDIERSMNVVASEQIAQALPNLRHITWQNITPDKKFPSGYFQPGGECEDSDEQRSFELVPLDYAIKRDADGRLVAVEPLGTH